MKQQGASNSEEKIDFKGGNVHVITSKENWDEKISEANKDGKIVSTKLLNDFKTIFLCLVWFLLLPHFLPDILNQVLASP